MMRGEAIRLGSRVFFQHACQGPVERSPPLLADPVGDDLADAVVMGVDRVVLVRPVAPHESARPEQVERLLRPREADAARLAEYASRERDPRHGDQFEHGPRVGRQGGDPIHHELGERRRSTLRRCSRGAHGVGQLGDEERMTPGVAPDRARDRCRAGLVRRKRIERELLGGLRRERRERELDAHRKRGRVVEDGVEHRSTPVGQRPVGPDEEERKLRVAQQRPDEERALGVAPLEIVHPDDDRRAGAEPLEQLLERRDRSEPYDGMVRGLGPPARRVLDRSDGVQCGEQHRQVLDALRNEVDRLALLEAIEHADDVVDQTVRRLVSHRLALAAATRQEPRALTARRLDERLDERRLSDTRGAVKQRDRRPPLPGGLELSTEGRELCVAIDEPSA